MTTRHLLIVPLLSMLALGGCRLRGEGPATAGPEDEGDGNTSALQAQINSLDH